MRNAGRSQWWWAACLSGLAALGSSGVRPECEGAQVASMAAWEAYAVDLERAPGAEGSARRAAISRALRGWMREEGASERRVPADPGSARWRAAVRASERVERVCRGVQW